MCNIKCLKPVIILNPALKKRSDSLSTYFIKGKLFAVSSNLIQLEPERFSPRKNKVTLNDLENSYAVDVSTGERVPMYIAVPCGRCILCRRKKASALAARAIAETNTIGEPPLFITFTYNNENLPLNENGVPTLKKLDYQLFMKRLRRLLDNYNIEHNLRYLACGEYGSHTHRPHYHVLLWNFPKASMFKTIIDVQKFIQKAWSKYLLDVNGKRIPERQFCSNCPYHTYKQNAECHKRAHTCLRMHFVKYPSGAPVYRRLPIGSIKILPATSGAPAYITKYMAKGTQSPEGCEKGFIVSSNRGGGIGSAYIRQCKSEILSAPQIEGLPVVDKVCSGRVFYIPIDSYVKRLILPAPSSYLKKKDYDVVRSFASHLFLWHYFAKQLYRLWRMDKLDDFAYTYYYDSFTEFKSNPLWNRAFNHVRDFLCEFPELRPNLGSFLKTQEDYNDYFMEISNSLDYLSTKVLQIPIDHNYFAQRESYLNNRSYVFERKYKSAPPLNLEALAEAATRAATRNEWKERF